MSFTTIIYTTRLSTTSITPLGPSASLTLSSLRRCATSPIIWQLTSIPSKRLFCLIVSQTSLRSCDALAPLGPLLPSWTCPTPSSSHSSWKIRQPQSCDGLRHLGICPAGRPTLSVRLPNTHMKPMSLGLWPLVTLLRHCLRRTLLPFPLLPWWKPHLR